MNKNLSNEVVRWQEKLFKRSIRRQVRLQKIKGFLGATSHQNILEITAGDPLLSSRLHAGGGAWTTLTLDSETATSFSWFIHSEVKVVDEAGIDALDHTYDVVLLTDVLERVRDDRSLIKACHRVLKPEGRLVIHGMQKSFLGLDQWIRPMRAWERTGYTSHEFFDVLKDGFDVPETVAYSTYFFEFLGVIGERIANTITGGPYTQPGKDIRSEQFYQYRQLQFLVSSVFPLMWLLGKIDSMLFFLPGRWVIAKTKRRVWRKRRTPILVDGRSIAEAALNTKIGTAAPF